MASGKLTQIRWADIGVHEYSVLRGTLDSFVVQQGRKLRACEPAGTIISIGALMESIRPIIKQVYYYYFTGDNIAA